MRKNDGKRVYLEKPDDWRCPFDGVRIQGSPAPIELLWMLPLDGCIAHWGQPYLFSGGVSAKVKIHGNRSGFSVHLSIAAAATVACARCLSDAPLEISGDFRYFYKPLSLIDSCEDDDDEYDTVFVQDIEGEVDISDQVWESLILSLPEKVLCSPDCRGICPVCGVDRNKGDCGCSGESVDPRFEILAGQESSKSDNIPGKGGNQHGNSKK